jgi:uncharacterized protein (TIGR03663 family)
MHGDEAVQASKTGILFDTGRFEFNPREYHGPALHYAALPILWLSGARSFAETTEVAYRLVPVVFGVGLILLLLLVGDGLGWSAALCAGILTAISPAMVFYSRYYIHEMLLVFFTFAAIAAGWRYAWSRKVGWAILVGACLGLMHATKETCALAYAAMGLALLGKLTWRWWWGYPIDLPAVIRWRDIGLAALAAVAVSFILFSSFFTHGRGPLDSLLAFVEYVKRSGGDGFHEHPWDYYLKMLLYTQFRRGPWWSEALIMALALVGFVAVMVRWRVPEARRPLTLLIALGALLVAIGFAAFAPWPWWSSPWVIAWLLLGTVALALSGDAPESNTPLARFLAFYTLFLTALYAVVPYKTPWCLLGFLHGMILLAGVGTVVLLRNVPTHLLKVVAGIMLALVAYQLAGQAYRASYKFPSDDRNPYVYAHPVPDLLNIAQRAEQIAALHPEGHRMVIRVITPDWDCWPLPWYLRRFPNARYSVQPPDRPDAPMIIASPLVRAELEANLGGERKANEGYFTETRGFRPSIRLLVYIRRDLWGAFVRHLEDQRK